MNMPVTPGFGAFVASDNVGGAHHQRVISHSDRARSSISPALSTTAYASGQCLGGELAFLTASRFAGRSSVLESLVVTIDGKTSLDFDLILFAEPFAAPVANGAAFSIPTEELRQILGIVKVRAADFVAVGTDGVATLALDLPVFSGVGDAYVRGAIIARAAYTPVSVDALTISGTFRRD